MKYKIWRFYLSNTTGSTEDFDVDIPFKTVESDTFNVYYLEDPTYDQDLGGTVYKFKFMEVLNGN